MRDPPLNRLRIINPHYGNLAGGNNAPSYGHAAGQNNAPAQDADAPGAGIAHPSIRWHPFSTCSSGVVSDNRIYPSP